ncbi:uncharacterized protein Triagg1_2488 [Trichoderma aggressivum f. europaeum]|uniref:Uncharacterized protein n=1 Tax=Trichoderma aggressivum f. europaeum TaxID=173218 RepID=A0AAE1JF20_9HYPO|nr:hypothetical protein Triagg1_2488 [Trichoderma aggressivum f. europaeum]
MMDWATGEYWASKSQKNVCDRYQLAQKTPCYLDFEIMEDGRPHDTPYVGCPTIGPFEDFGKASSLGIRIVWKADGKWLSIPIHALNWAGAIGRGIINNDRNLALSAWFKAMTTIQIFERIIYTGPLNGFNKVAYFATANIVELVHSHLDQSMSWIPTKSQTLAAPRLVDFEENCRLMYQQYLTWPTLVNPIQPPPVESDFWKGQSFNHTDANLQAPTIKCDFCEYTQRGGQNAWSKCERDTTIEDYHVCKWCSMLNRPCTFTSPSDSIRLWGRGPPFLRGMRGERTDSSLAPARYPTGPFRFLAFYDIAPRDAVETDAPIEGLEPLLTLDSCDDNDVNVDLEGAEADVEEEEE